METGIEKKKLILCLKKKKKRRETFCVCLYISSLCPLALFPHLKPHPKSPILLTPFTQGATCYLCIQDATWTRKYLRSDLPIPFSVPHTHTHSKWKNIPTRSQYTSTLLSSRILSFGARIKLYCSKTRNIKKRWNSRTDVKKHWNL